jgi:uncharacterized protein
LYVILLGIPVLCLQYPFHSGGSGTLMLGASPGAAIAYMIAGPATNLGELNAIRNSMGKKPALFYVGCLIVIAAFFRIYYRPVGFPNYQYHAYRMQGELIIQQCCVPLIFGDRIGDPGAAYNIPCGTAVWNSFFAILVYGLIKKLRYFFVNPCKACTWKAYGADGTCGSKCHIRRKYEFIRHWK